MFDWSKESYGRFLADPPSHQVLASAGLRGPPEHAVVEPVGEPGS